MNITLINPPSPFLIDQKTFPPLGLMYIASSLEKHNYIPRIIDLSNHENDLMNELASKLTHKDINLFFITSTTPQYYYAKQIKNILKELYPECTVVIGGAHASSKPALSLQDGFDIVVAGEGEIAATKIANQISNQETIHPIISEPYITDINSIPYPSRHLIDIKSYKYIIPTGNATTLITSRGCPYSCAFCSKDVWKNTFRFHSPEYVYNELEILKHEYKFNNFLFVDDSFVTYKSRNEKLLNLIKSLSINYRCYINSTTDNKTLEELYNSGCVEVGIGVESGSQKILNNVNKKSKVDDNIRVIKKCKDIGIETNIFIMIGLPGENLTTIMETKRFMEKTLPDKFGFNIFVPYTGTPIYNHPEKYDIELHEMQDMQSWAKGRQGEYQCFVSTSELSREQILEQFNILFEYYTQLTKWKPGYSKL